MPVFLIGRSSGSIGKPDLLYHPIVLSLIEDWFVLFCCIVLELSSQKYLGAMFTRVWQYIFFFLFFFLDIEQYTL